MTNRLLNADGVQYCGLTVVFRTGDLDGPRIMFFSVPFIAGASPVVGEVSANLFRIVIAPDCNAPVGHFSF